MDWLREQLFLLLEALQSLFKQTREAYDGANRFARMRIWLVGAFAADVLLTLMVVLSSGADLEADAWFKPGFPSDLIVVRNEEPLSDVVITLDGRWVHRKSYLAPGVRGLDVRDDFRDDAEARPEPGYRPKVIQISADGDSITLPVSERAP